MQCNTGESSLEKFDDKSTGFGISFFPSRSSPSQNKHMLPFCFIYKNISASYYLRRIVRLECICNSDYSGLDTGQHWPFQNMIVYLIKYHCGRGM